MTVSRQNIVYDSFEQLVSIQAAGRLLRVPIVRFTGAAAGIDESIAVDAGGLRREWVSLLSTALNTYGSFAKIPDSGDLKLDEVILTALADAASEKASQGASQYEDVEAIAEEAATKEFFRTTGNFIGHCIIQVRSTLYARTYPACICLSAVHAYQPVPFVSSTI